MTSPTQTTSTLDGLPDATKARLFGAVLVDAYQRVLLRGEALLERERAVGTLWVRPAVADRPSLVQVGYLVSERTGRRWEIAAVRWDETGSRIEFRLLAVPPH